MKKYILISLFAFCSVSLAKSSAKSTKSECFIVDRCAEVLTSCKLVNYDPGYGIKEMAVSGVRTNIRHACPTNLGVKYIWEQGEVIELTYSSYETSPKTAKAEALQGCRETVSSYTQYLAPCN